jgi:Tfp pilus assembly pilus retraction ATPase PilT
MHVNDLLKIAVDSGASDLHLKVGSYPMLRVRGALVPAVSDKRLEHEDMVAMAASVLPTTTASASRKRMRSISPTRCPASGDSAATRFISAARSD